MPQRRLHAGPRCGVAGCKSTRYYKDESQTYCQNNHLQIGIVEYQIDEEEAMAGGMGQRRKRTKAVSGKPDKESATHHGKLGYATFLQAFQLLMRHQAKFIQEKLQVPGFEILLKDLWKQLLIAQEVGEKLPEVEDDIDEDNVGLPAPDDDHSDLDFQSDDDSESVPKQPSTYASARYIMHRPVLIHSVALCYIALNLLRVPITVHDVHSWMLSEAFPYIRAVRFLPVDLIARLTPGSYEALEPQSLPRASRIWRWTQQTALFLKIHTGIEFPQLNYRPVLFNMITDLMLPQTFNATIEALDIISLDLGILSMKNSSQNRLTPETRLIGLLLVMSKLLYSFDGVKRSHTSYLDPLARCPDLKALHRMTKLSISRLQGVDLVSKLQPQDVLGMTPLASDEYLDWFTRTWVHDLPKPSNPSTATPQGILEMFPVMPTSTQDKEQIQGLNLDRFKNIEWLYSQPYEPIQPGTLKPGQEYQLTSVNKPSTATLFDDLIELGSLLTSSSNQDLRKAITWTEQCMSQQHNVVQDVYD